MTARRFLALALLLFWAGYTTVGACVGRGEIASFRAAHPTVEPTLPLMVEMRLEDVSHDAAGSRARLVVVITADREIHDLDLALPALPADASVDTLELPARPVDLAAGESRVFSIPVRGPARKNLLLRLTASFRTADGQELRLGQGVTLSAEPQSIGRSHAGAWEVMAVPLGDVRP